MIKKFTWIVCKLTSISNIITEKKSGYYISIYEQPDFLTTLIEIQHATTDTCIAKNIIKYT